MIEKERKEGRKEGERGREKEGLYIFIRYHVMFSLMHKSCNVQIRVSISISSNIDPLFYAVNIKQNFSSRFF
jgi:hypothetical protein